MWPVDPIKDHLRKIGSGITPSGGAASYLAAGIPLLRSQNVHFDGLRLDDVAYIADEVLYPREVFAEALSDRASAIIVAHNHPAGSLGPSVSDVEATKQLKEAGIVMGIALLDHIIFNRNEYFSFLESGML